MRCGKAVLGLVLGMPGVALAQTPVSVVEDGDAIVGVGALETMADFNVNDAKTWTTRITTSNDNPNADSCVLRSGFVTLREGLFVSNPANSWIGSMNACEIDNRGNLALVLGIRTPTGGARSIDAVYWNSKLLAINGGVLTNPAVGQGTTYDTLEGVKINDRNMVLAIGSILNPSVTGSKEDALIRYTVDSVGNVVDTLVVATKGMVMPQLNGATVTTLLKTAATSYDMNANGDVICYFDTSSAAAIMLNMTQVLAMETAPSPVAGRVWNSFTGTAGAVAHVSLNDRGDYILSGILQGDAATAYLIEKNGQKFVQQGDVLPGLAPLSPTAGIAGTTGGGAPVMITNGGDVFWRATVDGVTEAAFMRNYQPIVIANHTVVDGKLVTLLIGGDGCFDVSPNGRFFIAGVEIDTIGEAALLVDFGLVLEIPGCFGNQGELSVTSGSARVGDHLTFAMDNGHAAPSGARINFSRRQRVPGSDCGVVGPYGEVLISGAHRIATLTLPTWNGTGPSTMRVDIPPSLSLIDATFFAQGQFRKPGSPISISLTNALRIEFGAP